LVRFWRAAAAGGIEMGRCLGGGCGACRPPQGSPNFGISELLLDGQVETAIETNHPVPTEGRFAIVTNVRRDAVDADGAFDEWR
jgi:hypothetical protein